MDKAYSVITGDNKKRIYAANLTSLLGHLAVFLDHNPEYQEAGGATVMGRDQLVVILPEQADIKTAILTALKELGICSGNATSHNYMDIALGGKKVDLAEPVSEEFAKAETLYINADGMRKLRDENVRHPVLNAIGPTRGWGIEI